tara:strand:+ start:1519 stop:2277 length:759 start_codon:yes stop_codon:yes gene_type:complete
MNYKIFILLILFTFSCTNQNLGKKIITNDIIYQKYSNNGFTLIYSDSLLKNKVVNKKLNDRDLLVLQKNLKKDTTVKITNPLNNKTIIAKVKSKSKYPNFYNSVITSRIASEIELDLNEPLILIESVDQNSVFYAGKAKTYDEEKNVADKAPVEGISIINISTETSTEKKDIKSTEKFNYIIKIANFYYEDSAKLVKERIMSETDIKKINIEKINPNNYRLSIGPFESIEKLKNSFEKMEALYFENLELVKK